MAGTPVRSPTWRYLPLTVSVPQGTAAASPQSTSWALGTVWLEAIEVRVPRGHARLTGLAIRDAGQRVLPYSDSVQWITEDGYQQTFLVQMQVSPALTVLTYNSDAVYAHSFYLRAQTRNIDLVTVPASAPAVPVF